MSVSNTGKKSREKEAIEPITASLARTEMAALARLMSVLDQPLRCATKGDETASQPLEKTGGNRGSTAAGRRHLRTPMREARSIKEAKRDRRNWCHAPAGSTRTAQRSHKRNGGCFSSGCPSLEGDPARIF